MGHRGRDAAGQLLDKWDAGDDPRVVRTNLGAHECDLRSQVRQPQYQLMESASITVKLRAGTSPKLLFLLRLKPQKVAESAPSPRARSAQNRQSIDDFEPAFAN